MPITKIDFQDQNQKALFVTWTLHSFCNYRCSYCPPGCHSGVTRPYQAADVIAFCLAVMEKARAAGFQRQTFAFSGGEPTMFPDFLGILERLSAEGVDVTFTTNGSKRIEWWEKAVGFFNHCVISYHPEMANEDNFYRTIELLTKTVWVNVDMMMTKEHFEKNVAFAQRLKLLPNVRVDFLPIQKEFGGESEGLIDYSEDQITFLRNRPTAFPPMSGLVKEKIQKEKFFGRGPKLVTYANNGLTETKPLDYKDLIARDLNQFAGWNCWAGVESLIVDMHGKVYRAYCYEGGQIGTIWNPQELPTTPVKCSQMRCKCSVDIEVSKVKPTDVSSWVG